MATTKSKIFEYRYVLWGIGKNGNNVINLLGCKCIIAAIDTNPKFQGTIWNGLSVINIEMYLKNYKEYPLIISPVKNEGIIEILNQYNISNYILYNDLLLEIYRLSIPQYLNYKYLNYKYIDWTKFWQEINDAKYPIMHDNPEFAPTSIMFSGKLTLFNGIDVPKEVDLILVQGIGDPHYDFLALAKITEERQLPMIFTEAGFLYSILPFNGKSHDKRLLNGHSIIFDSGNLYYNAAMPSGIEQILNSDLILSDKELKRARILIDKILKNKISKYNCQPTIKLNLGRTDKPKVLVVDQVFDDKSITFGMANDDTFADMLEVAKSENPDADIIIKSHPDLRKGHYNQTSQDENVYFISQGVNPISLLENIDKVYVCTSQMGFEAAMCGKEVNVFGMPFYAGWGITKDRQTCLRRTKKRTIEEIFYMAYIMYTRYVSYKTNNICEIEQAIDEILELREEYFQSIKS